VTAPRPWRTLASRYLVDDRWLKLRADDCETADGRAVSPYYVIEVPDFVEIAAITQDRQLVMVRQYRQGTRRIHLELPAGIIEADDADVAAAGARELREETGYAAQTWTALSVWHANPPRMTSRAHLMLAEGAHLAGAPQTDGVESLTVELVPLAQAREAVMSGEIDSSQHVAAVLRVLAELERR
jgi:8-oxo-dGTP pyrophosphatase MutT (NUDIX family)